MPRSVTPPPSKRPSTGGSGNPQGPNDTSMTVGRKTSSTMGPRATVANRRNDAAGIPAKRRPGPVR